MFVLLSDESQAIENPDEGPHHPRPERTSLGNLGIDLYTAGGFTDELIDHAMTGKVTRQIVTVNAQFYVLADKMAAFRSCLRRAEYLCADGMPIVWACNMFGKRKVPRIAGVDLIGSMCSQGAPLGMRVYLLGGQPGTAQATAAVLGEKCPGIVIAGVDCPSWGFEKDSIQLDEVLERIEDARPHVVFLALGAPRQELFIDRHIRPLGVPIAVGIGGSFEILSGQTQRAPEWMRSKGLEWFYRLVHDPVRLAERYLVGNAEFLWCVAKWRYRASSFAGAGRLDKYTMED